MIIFLDMDGVVVDFAKGVFKLFNKEELLDENSWPIGEKRFETLLGLSTNDMWEAIDQQGPDFWSSLDPYPWGLGLYEKASKLAPTYFLSSPSWNCDSLRGKKLWLDKYYGKRFRNYIFTTHKHLLAAESRILVDDTDEHILKFQEGGATGLLFGRPWNVLGSWDGEKEANLILKALEIKAGMM